MIVKEIKGLYHCVTLADKDTLRLFPLQSAIVEDAKVSQELHDLEDIGEVMLMSEPKKETQKEDKGGNK